MAKNLTNDSTAFGFMSTLVAFGAPLYVIPLMAGMVTVNAMTQNRLPEFSLNHLFTGAALGVAGGVIGMPVYGHLRELTMA